MRTNPFGRMCSRNRRLNSWADTVISFCFVATRVIPPSKRDVLSVEGNEPMVGDGNAVRIPTQVANDLVRPAKGGLGINDPILPKQRSQKGGEVPQFRQMFNRTGTGETFLQMQAPQRS